MSILLKRRTDKRNGFIVKKNKLTELLMSTCQLEEFLGGKKLNLIVIEGVLDEETIKEIYSDFELSSDISQTSASTTEEVKDTVK